MATHSFLLNNAELDFDTSGRSTVSFLGPQAYKAETHITLIAGANGTSKSRLLASLVEQLCEIEARRVAVDSSRRFPSTGGHGLLCSELSAFVNGQLSEFSTKPNSDSSELSQPFGLPSRILVLSNLVMDKFHFPSGITAETQFYHYLGVRQATNLTTTGSLERAVTEAVLSIASDQQRLQSFQAWIELVFSGERELAFQFPRFRLAELEKYLNTNNKAELIRERMQRRMGSRRSINIESTLIEQTVRDVTELFEFLNGKITDYQSTPKQGRNQPDPLMRLVKLAKSDKERLGQLAPLFSSASRAGYSAWPSLCIEANPWLQFNQLSSGEQNILSVGAKLIANARAGCLIAIDEPEVSLNVAWQQHYTDLIRKSLVLAPGSHVLIATHSPHLIASLTTRNASILMIEKNQKSLSFKTVDAQFEGWGSESVLYQVLRIPSASSYLFHRELANVLEHLQNNGTDKNLIDGFLQTAKKIDFAGIDPLEEVIAEIQAYAEALN